MLQINTAGQASPLPTAPAPQMQKTKHFYVLGNIAVANTKCSEATVYLALKKIQTFPVWSCHL